LLVNHFIKKYAQSLSKNVVGIHPKALERFMNYSWYGNVRELENMIERAIVLTDRDQIELENLPIEIQDFQDKIQMTPLSEDEYSIKKASKVLEMNLIKKALKKTKGNHTHAAKILEISHRALLYKIKEYGILDGEF
jgi:two-component system response regulator AtoC